MGPWLWLRLPRAGAATAGAATAPPGRTLCSPQALVLEQAAQGSGPPDLRMQYLRQIQANHEVSWAAEPSRGGTRRRDPPTAPTCAPHPRVPPQMLLKEAQTLRDQPSLGEDGTATVEKLLHVYQQLRNPSLVLL